MEPSYALTAWLFSRFLSLVYLVAFLSLMAQARGLWGSQGILPISQYANLATQQLGLGRFVYMPSFFYLNSSDAALIAVAGLGILAAVAALLGFAQGWMLLLCYLCYLSFTSLGQDFLSFQWDTLLLEVGFLALFAVPWQLGFSPWSTAEPHWAVRWMFYGVIFKLIFLSGLVKILSGDETWRNFTAMNFHFWTQPIPNFLSPFFHGLPKSVQWFNTLSTFIVELILPFLIFHSRTRFIAGVGFVLLNIVILVSGNFAFFNWLTIGLCLWLLPTSWLNFGWLPKLQLVDGPNFYVSAPAMGVLAALTFFWCIRFVLPRQVHVFLNPALQLTSGWSISNSYGLFATMTTDRPEIILEGSNDGQSWLEYEFKYKAGDLKRRPPWIAPLQPRLDWQMWFAALGSFQQSPWMDGLMARIEEGSPSVLALLEKNPFPDQPPQYLRARLYRYEFLTPSEILRGEGWWKRTLLGDYSPVFKRQ